MHEYGTTTLGVCSLLVIINLKMFSDIQTMVMLVQNNETIGQ